MRKSRDLAIKNIKEKYIFIGITEQFSESLELLEYIFPSAFTVDGEVRGLTKMNEIWGEVARKKFATFKKPETELRVGGFGWFLS